MASLRSQYELAPGDLARSLESVSRHFLRWSGTEHYASLFLGEYERASGRLRYANCGHVPPIVLRPGLRVERLRAMATVLGIFEGWSGVTAETPLDEGDLLLVASDGVTEATNTRGEPFGDRRLLESLEAHRDLRVAALLRAVAREVGTMKALEFQGIRRAYTRGVHVLDGVSFAMAPGEVVGLLGRNGAGKTTLIRIAMGMIEPQGGEVLVLGMES